MSQFWAGYHGTALVLNASEYISMLDQYEKKVTLFTGQEKQKEISHFLHNIEENIREFPFTYSSDLARNDKQRSFFVTPVSPDDCDGMWFCQYCKWGDPEASDVSGEYDRKEEKYIFFSERQLFRPYGEMPYRTYEELENEFKEKLAGYLPADFNWEGHIGLFSYAAFA